MIVAMPAGVAESRSRERWLELAGYLAAIGGPVLLTAILVIAGGGPRNYVFLYMGVVAILAVLRGLVPSLLAAAASFLLVDYFFIPPYGIYTIADPQDLLNLVVFFGTAGVVGSLASLRRRTLLHAQAALRLARSEQQVQVLQQTEQYHRDLLASVSHDLRTPIGSILTDSTNLLRTQSMNASVRESLEGIAAEARRLGRLVGEMLDMARIEGNALQLNLEPVDLAQAVTSAIERLHKTSPGRPVVSNADEVDASVLADWDRLGQIFDNLLLNADRFGLIGTPIEVRISQEDSGVVTVRVVDHGPGVPAELRERLFDRFVKGEADGGGGTGLGLAIVRGLVEAHAGSIALDSSTNGASFRFTLPKA